MAEEMVFLNYKTGLSDIVNADKTQCIDPLVVNRLNNSAL